MVVFDVSNLTSLAHCQQWLNEASRSNVGPYHIFLVGAKKDLLVSIDNNIHFLSIIITIILENASLIRYTT